MADINNRKPGAQFSQELDRPESLSNVVQRGKQQITEVSKKGDPTTPLEDEAAQYYLDQLKQLNESYSPVAPPSSRKALADAMDRAEQLYKERATRNEWLEVAQILGRAGAQFAAAQSGMKSERNMAGLDMGPGIDYGSRTDRAFREYQQELRNVGDLDTANRQQYTDEARVAEGQYDKRKDYLSRGLSASLEDARIRRSERREDERDRRRAKREDEQNDKQLRSLNYRELEGQEKDLQSKLKARQTLVNMLNQEGDLSTKSATKLQEKYGTLAAQGDIDLAELKGELDKKVKPGKLNELTGGLIPTESADEDAQKQVLNSKVSDLKNLLDGVKERKQELLGAQKPTPAGVEAKAPPADREAAPGTSETPSEKQFDKAQLAAYAAQYKMSEDEARKFLEGQGYTFTGK